MESGGAAGKVLYIDTEGGLYVQVASSTCQCSSGMCVPIPMTHYLRLHVRTTRSRPERIRQIALERGVPPDEVRSSAAGRSEAASAVMTGARSLRGDAELQPTAHTPLYLNTLLRYWITSTSRLSWCVGIAPWSDRVACVRRVTHTPSSERVRSHRMVRPASTVIARSAAES